MRQKRMGGVIALATVVDVPPLRHTVPRQRAGNDKVATGLGDTPGALSQSVLLAPTSAPRSASSCKVSVYPSSAADMSAAPPPQCQLLMPRPPPPPSPPSHAPVYPKWSPLFTSAPRSTNICTISVCPCRAAPMSAAPPPQCQLRVPRPPHRPLPLTHPSLRNGPPCSHPHRAAPGAARFRYAHSTPHK